MRPSGQGLADVTRGLHPITAGKNQRQVSPWVMPSSRGLSYWLLTSHVALLAARGLCPRNVEANWVDDHARGLMKCCCFIPSSSTAGEVLCLQSIIHSFIRPSNHSFVQRPRWAAQLDMYSSNCWLPFCCIWLPHVMFGSVPAKQHRSKVLFCTEALLSPQDARLPFSVTTVDLTAEMMSFVQSCTWLQASLVYGSDAGTELATTFCQSINLSPVYLKCGIVRMDWVTQSRLIGECAHLAVPLSLTSMHFQ